MSKNIRKTKYAVTYVEYGDSVDGRPRCLGVFDTREEAIKELKLDMETYANSVPSAGVFMDYDGWGVWADEECKFQLGCAWNVNEIEI